MKIKIQNYCIVALLLRALCINCMEQPEELLKREMAQLTNKLELLAETLKVQEEPAQVAPLKAQPKQRGEEASLLKQPPCRLPQPQKVAKPVKAEISLLPAEVVSVILEKLVPRTIQNEENLIDVLKSITNFIITNRINYMFAQDEYSLTLIKRALIKSIQSTQLVKDALFAISIRKPKILKSLKDLLQTIKKEFSELEEALKKGDVAGTLQNYIKNGYNPNLIITDSRPLIPIPTRGKTLFFFAIDTDTIDLVKFFLDHGADIKQTANIAGMSYTPVSYAIINGHTDVGRYLNKYENDFEITKQAEVYSRMSSFFANQ